jgi:hypothetical protein
MLLAVQKAAGGFLADAQGGVCAVVIDRTATIRDVVDTVSIDEEALASQSSSSASGFQPPH